MRSLEAAAVRVREGASVVFFPEGTRSRTGVATGDMGKVQAGCGAVGDQGQRAAVAGSDFAGPARGAFQPDSSVHNPSWAMSSVRFGAPLPTDRTQPAIATRDASPKQWRRSTILAKMPKES